MKPLYNRKGVRRGDGDRSQFAFFLTGAVVVLAVVFVIGIQVGRVIEKNIEKREVAAGKTGGPIVLGGEPPTEIGREIEADSEATQATGSTTTPSPEERVRETERSVTFRNTLVKKEPELPKLVHPKRETSPGPAPARPSAESPAGSRLFVQVAAFRKLEGAETMRDRLEKSGYHSIIAPSGSGTSGVIHRVLVGPYFGKLDAGKALRKIAGEFRTQPFLVRH